MVEMFMKGDVYKRQPIMILDNATKKVKQTPIKNNKFSFPFNFLLSKGNTHNNIAQAAFAVCPDGKDLNSSPATPKAIS